MSKRSDLAAPTIIDPTAFKFVAGVYFGSNQNEDFNDFLGQWADEMGINEDGKYGWYSKRPAVLEAHPPLNPAGNFVRKGTCDHCGARFDWGSVYQHTGGLHIVVGNTCAEKTLEMPSRFELDVSRMKAKLAAQRKAERTAEVARKLAAIEGYEWLYAIEDHDNKTLNDIAAKGLKFGGLTHRQLEMVLRIHNGTPAEWEVKRAERAAVRAAEDAAAEPVPATADRIAVEGEVISLKESEGFMGETVLKMLVKTTKGFKLYGTKPRDLKVERGTRVAFTARIERSRQDDKFGFFSRPTKAHVVAA